MLFLQSNVCGISGRTLKNAYGFEPVTPLRQSGALADYAIPAYKSFPVGNVSKLT